MPFVDIITTLIGTRALFVQADSGGLSTLNFLKYCAGQMLRRG